MNAAQSDPRAGAQPDPLVRVAVVGAPGFMLGYGVLRLVDGIDGEYGPGLAWTAGHVLFLMSLLLFVALHIGFRRLVPATRPVHRVIATVAAIVGILGLIAFVRVILIDIVVGLRAADQAEMSDLSDRLADIPGFLPNDLLFVLGPLLFQVGLLTLAIQLATVRPRRLPALSPVLVVLAFATIVTNLNLLPVTAALFLLAFLPLLRRVTV